MGQMVNPHGLRVGIIKDWDSVWYPEPEPSFEFEDGKSEIKNYLSLRIGKVKNWILQFQISNFAYFFVRKLKYFRRKC